VIRHLRQRADPLVLHPVHALFKRDAHQPGQRADHRRHKQHRQRRFIALNQAAHRIAATHPHELMCFKRGSFCFHAIINYW
jgi:hypothetical protein